MSSDQARFWSAVARGYEDDFVDPHSPGTRSPLPSALRELAGKDKTVADLGCGTGPLLPALSDLFGRVLAVDFAEGMLERARRRCAGLGNVEFFRRSLADLSALRGRADVAVAVNSLVMPQVGEIESALAAVHALLRPGGHFLGIVPALDGVHYHTMLLLDRARATGMPEPKARQNAAHHAEHSLYDFAFGTFSYKGLRQHFWQPFEVRYRLERAGFRRVRTAKVHLAWEQFAGASDLRAFPPPWDWFFRAET